MNERWRQKRVHQTRHRLIAAIGTASEPTKSRLKAILRGLEGRTIAEQEEFLTEALKALWEEMAPTAVGLYGVLENYISRQTGMTVQDFIWLRDYERRMGEAGEDG